MTDDFREQRLEALRAKLKAREGKPGLKANVGAIKEQIAELESGYSSYRGDDGRFVTLEHMTQNPETTERA